MCNSFNSLDKQKNPQLCAGYLHKRRVCPARCAFLWLFHSFSSVPHFYCPLSGLATGMGWGVSSLNAFTILCEIEIISYLRSLQNAVLWSPRLKSEGISETPTILFESTQKAHE